MELVEFYRVRKIVLWYIGLAMAAFLFAAFFAVTAALASAFLPALVSSVGVVGAAALFVSHPHARFVVYGASAVVALSWLVVIARTAFAGWPVAGSVQSLISLIPGLLLLSICIGCAILAARYPSRNA